MGCVFDKPYRRNYIQKQTKRPVERNTNNSRYRSPAIKKYENFTQLPPTANQRIYSSGCHPYKAKNYHRQRSHTTSSVKLDKNSKFKAPILQNANIVSRNYKKDDTSKFINYISNEVYQRIVKKLDRDLKHKLNKKNNSKSYKYDSRVQSITPTNRPNTQVKSVVPFGDFPESNNPGLISYDSARRKQLMREFANEIVDILKERLDDENESYTNSDISLNENAKSTTGKLNYDKVSTDSLSPEEPVSHIVDTMESSSDNKNDNAIAEKEFDFSNNSNDMEQWSSFMQYLDKEFEKESDLFTNMENLDKLVD